MLAVQNCPRGVSSNGFLGEVSISQRKEGFKRQKKGKYLRSPYYPLLLDQPHQTWNWTRELMRELDSVCVCV